MSKHLLFISTYGRILGLVLQEAKFGRKFTTAVATRRGYPFGATPVQPVSRTTGTLIAMRAPL